MKEYIELPPEIAIVEQTNEVNNMADSKDDVLDELSYESKVLQLNKEVVSTNDDVTERKKNRYVRQVGGGRGSEYSCACGLRSCEDKTKVFTSNLLSKCRQCQNNVLTTHLSTYWTCHKCLIEHNQVANHIDDNQEN